MDSKPFTSHPAKLLFFIYVRGRDHYRPSLLKRKTRKPWLDVRRTALTPSTIDLIEPARGSVRLRNRLRRSQQLPALLDGVSRRLSIFGKRKLDDTPSIFLKSRKER